jgi:hypothetical protein
MLLDILKQTCLVRCLGMLQCLCGMGAGRRIANPCAKQTQATPSNPATIVLRFIPISSIVALQLQLRAELDHLILRWFSDFVRSRHNQLPAKL